MNYYEHHIGDFDSATAHLSLVEDAVYRRLICLYYRSEAPIPADVKQACRLVRAVTKAERDTVADVLREFFTLQEDGWHNNRCDEEIARFQDKQRKARASADARWSKGQAHTGRNANASPDAMRTHSEGNADGMHRAPVPSLQTPDTTSVAELPQGEGAKRAQAPTRPEGVDSQVWSDWLALRRAKKAPVTPTVVERATSEAKLAGLSLEDFLRVWCARGSQGLLAEWLKPDERRPSAGRGDSSDPFAGAH